jgi:hypothetical protein
MGQRQWQVLEVSSEEKKNIKKRREKKKRQKKKLHVHTPFLAVTLKKRKQSSTLQKITLHDAYKKVVEPCAPVFQRESGTGQKKKAVARPRSARQPSAPRAQSWACPPQKARFSPLFQPPNCANFPARTRRCAGTPARQECYPVVCASCCLP